MAILARRFTIISLVMVIFAFLLADAVHRNNIAQRPYLSGDLFICVTGKEPLCTISDIAEQ